MASIGGLFKRTRAGISRDWADLSPRHPRCRWRHGTLPPGSRFRRKKLLAAGQGRLQAARVRPGLLPNRRAGHCASKGSRIAREDRWRPRPCHSAPQHSKRQACGQLDDQHVQGMHVGLHRRRSRRRTERTLCGSGAPRPGRSGVPGDRRARRPHYQSGPSAGGPRRALCRPRNPAHTPGRKQTAIASASASAPAHHRSRSRARERTSRITKRSPFCISP